jgi:WD40 repeat protein
VNDICVLSDSHFVAALSNGNVHVYNVTNPIRGLTKLDSTKNVQAQSACATALCVVDEEVFIGGKDGTITKASLSHSSNASSIFYKELSEVQCLIACGPHLFLSGHSSGQIHLWDTRANIAIEDGTAPVTSRAVCPLNEAVTAMASHPAQSNVIGYGTESGEVAFTDIRRRDNPGRLKISQDPILGMKFHPIYANNCFSISQSALFHWDATSLAKHVVAPAMDDEVEFRSNVWLMDSAWNTIQLNALLENEPHLISSFDVSNDGIVVGSDSCHIALLTHANFM